MNNDQIRNLVLMELTDDPLNFNAIGAAIESLAQGVDIVPYERPQRKRKENYFNIIANYSLDVFHEHFKMSRTTFQNLLYILHRNMEGIDEHMIDEKKLLFTIWMLSKQESFTSASDRFNLAKSSGHKIFCETTKLLINLRYHYIVWPDEDERQRISRTIQAKSGIRGVVGAIDVCHIPIRAPPHNQVDYYNQNNYHSIILQAVCNDREQFIDIFVGLPGGMNNASVFRNSPLHAALTDCNPPIHINEHLLGDSTYPLMPFLLKPYRCTSHLSRSQIGFNGKLGSVRSIIKQTFRLLEEKFQRLEYLDMTRIDLVPEVVTAACVLYNFILTHEGLPDEEEYKYDVSEETTYYNNEDQLNPRNAQHKRDYIASLL